jgi:hypothetical protein
MIKCHKYLKPNKVVKFLRRRSMAFLSGRAMSVFLNKTPKRTNGVSLNEMLETVLRKMTGVFLETPPSHL